MGNDNYQNYESAQSTRQTEYLLCVKRFHGKVKMGLFYVCVICNRCLYFSNVISKLNTNVTSFDWNYHICKICDTHTRKLKVSGQTVVNGLLIGKIPKELDCLNTLSLVLISKRILSKKRLSLCLKGTHQKCMVE